MDHIQQPRPPFQCWFSTGYVCRVGALVMAKSLIILVSTLAQSSSLTLTRLLYCSHEVGILTSLALWRSSCTCTMRTKWPWKNVAGLPNVCFRGFRFAGLPNPSTNHATVAATTQGAAVRGVLKKKWKCSAVSYDHQNRLLLLLVGVLVAVCEFPQCFFTLSAFLCIVRVSCCIMFGFFGLWFQIQNQIQNLKFPNTALLRFGQELKNWDILVKRRG